ncbi:MAG: dethiobiotin synthase [Fibrobacterota bacterium]|nr:dethiobiotin synthase [Fibrobacterota bacterium]
MGRTLFITGTGTDVGKTALSLAVLFWARKRGLSAAYHKPIQCGTFRFGEPPVEGGDADWIRAMAARPPSYGTPSSRTGAGREASDVTYRLRLAASPHLAAEKEDISIDLGRIRRDIEALADWHDLVIVEGAGGPAVPVDRKGATLGALAAEMSLPALIACAPGLGTLHHTLCTLAYLKSIGAPVAGFAFCHREAQIPELCRDNIDTLVSLTGLPFFGELAFSGKLYRSETLGLDEADLWSAPLAASLEAWWNPERK